MKHKLITLAVVAALSSAPALADEPRREWTPGKAGVIAGGVLGALVGGPPGLIAGAAFGGLATDREVKRRHAGTLENELGLLQRQHQVVGAERGTLRAQVDELARVLERERTAAAGAVDAASLADGLEFAVGFRTNSSTPPERTDEGLAALALLVAAVPSLEVHLDGYADPRGSDELNRQLSQARAEAIRDRLVAAGVDPRRVHLAAHGAVPGGSEADPDGWALQRRVSIRLERAEGRLAARP